MRESSLGVKWCNWNKMKQNRRKRGKTRRQVVCSTLQLSELTVLHCWMSKRTEVAWSYIHHQRHKWILRIADSFPVHMLCNFLWKHFCRLAIGKTDTSIVLQMEICWFFVVRVLHKYHCLFVSIWEEPRSVFDEKYKYQHTLVKTCRKNIHIIFKEKDGSSATQLSREKEVCAQRHPRCQTQWS